MHERASLRDVAEQAGVHISTASRALDPAQRARLLPGTVERVQAVADQLDYSANPLARGLRTRRTMSIGVVISDIANPLFATLIAGIQQHMTDHGFSTIIAEASPSSPDSLANAVDTLLARRVDGIALAIAGRDGAVVADLIEQSIPVVLLNRLVDRLPVPSIVGDDVGGMRVAVDHLTEIGHARIGHIAGPKDTSTGVLRREGFAAAMTKAGLAPDSIEEATWFQAEPGYAATRRLLTSYPDLTALVCANDLLAFGAYRAARELDREVGVDLSVTGYNNSDLLDLVSPRMTSVDIPYRRMGVLGARLLHEAITMPSNDPAPPLVTLDAVLVVRDSTGPPR